MKTAPLVISVVVIAILVVGVAYFVLGVGMAKTSSTNAETSSASPTLSVASTSTSSGEPETVQVSIPKGVSTSQSLDFLPANITLVIGVNNTVTWTNNDAAPHTVTATSVPSGAAKFSSGNLNGGAVFTYTFTMPGTYSYDCTYHYWMRGTITVDKGP
jgi:plastocyanin